ncbi:MAG: hypothetical protein PHU14_07170 [Methylovulum sp.]|nr:hypothetical protein [Methylovulum sp.]
MTLLIDYLQLCWFVNNPTDLHPARAFFWKNVLFYVVSGIIVEANIGDFPEATLEVAMRTIVALMLLSTQILSTKKSAVFYQLQTAVFICENFMMTLGIGVEIFDAFAHGTQYQDYPLYLGALLVVWYLAVISYIFKRVFAFHYAQCIGMAFVYFALTYGGPFLLMEVI